MNSSEKDRAVDALQRYLGLVRAGYGHDQAKGRLQELTKSGHT